MDYRLKLWQRDSYVAAQLIVAAVEGCSCVPVSAVYDESAEELSFAHRPECNWRRHRPLECWIGDN